MTIGETISNYKTFDGTLILVGDESKKIAEWLEELKEYKELEVKLIGHTGCGFDDWIKHTTSFFD